MSRFTKYAWFVVAYNIFVILWGAYVRATGSGAGCGEHWPLCNGEILPRSPQLTTVIELTHRLTSGLALIAVVALVIRARKEFPKRSLERRTAWLSLLFTVTEALVGAGLVLLGHVASNQSVLRGWSLSIHLVNTMILLACLTLVAWFARGPATAPPRALSRRVRTLVYFSAAVFLAVGVSGAVAALGDTLFKAESLSEGMRQDFDPSAHPFVRLRVLHPFLAVAAAGCLVGLGLTFVNEKRYGRTIANLASAVIGVTILQILIGAMNLLMLAPVWLQLIHLLTADLLWICLTLLAADVLGWRHRAQVSPAVPPAGELAHLHRSS